MRYGLILTCAMLLASSVCPADEINVSIGGVTTSVNGVWRKVLYVPRGIGGKYVTALDVTGNPGNTKARVKVSHNDVWLPLTPVEFSPRV